MTITELTNMAHKNAVDKGFYEKTDLLLYSLGAEGCPEEDLSDTIKEAKNNIIATRLMLIVSELGEALEALRNNKRCTNRDIKEILRLTEDELFKTAYDKYIKGTFEEEIADVPIRLADMSKYLGIDLENHIKAKMRYNSMRPKLHGKEF